MNTGQTVIGKLLKIIGMFHGLAERPLAVRDWAAAKIRICHESRQMDFSWPYFVKLFDVCPIFRPFQQVDGAKEPSVSDHGDQLERVGYCGQRIAANHQ